MMSQEDLESAKRQPYYKSIVRSFLQKQIQFLLDQMSYEVGEESVIMTVNLHHGTMSHLGTPAGNAFIEDMADVKTMFQTYCLTKFSEGMFDTPHIQDFPGNKRTNQSRSLPPSKRQKRTSKATVIKKNQKQLPNKDDQKRVKGESLDYSIDTGLQDTDETSGLDDEASEVRQGGNNEFDLFFKNSYDPISGENDSERTGTSDTETSNSRVEISDNTINQGASSSEFPESNNDLAGFAEEYVNSVVKIEPGIEDEQLTEQLSEQTSEQPTYNYVGSSNKYMGTDGVVVSISKAGSEGSQSRKRRCTISIAEKKEIVAYKMLNPKMTQDDIATHFARQWGKTVARSTVSEILKDREKWLGIPEDTNLMFRNRTGKHGKLECILFQWYREKRKKKTYVSDDMIMEKGKEVGGVLGIKDFSYSRGWVQKFKKRHSITSKGQNNSNSGHTIPSQIEKDLSSPIEKDLDLNKQSVDSQRLDDLASSGNVVSVKIENVDNISVKIENDLDQIESSDYLQDQSKPT